MKRKKILFLWHYNLISGLSGHITQKTSFLLPPPLFSFVNDIPHDEHSERIATASLVNWVLSGSEHRVLLAICCLWKPRITASTSIRVYTVKKLAVNPPPSLWKRHHLFPRTPWNTPFMFSLRKTASFTKSFLTKQ